MDICKCRLDVMPSTVLKFRSNGDEQTAQLLEEVIYKVTDLVQEQCEICAACLDACVKEMALSQGSVLFRRPNKVD